MKKTVVYILWGLFLMGPSTLWAQEASQDQPVRKPLPIIGAERIKEARESSLSKDSILIGDQIWWTLPVPKEAFDPAVIRAVEAPELPETVTEGVEALEPFCLDSLYTRRHLTGIDAKVRLTSFDSGSYVLPYMPLYLRRLDGGTDTLWFKGPMLYVNTIPIDTTTFKAYDIKPQMTYPISAKEVFTWLGVLLGVAGIVALLIWIAKRRKAHKPIFGSLKPQEPAHIVALKALDKIKAQQLWKHNKVKLYYTQLTETLRLYLRDRWHIQAMEQTSSEMMDALQNAAKQDPALAKNVLAHLQEMLTVSDLVKFAKYIPSEDENEDALQQAVRFVTATALADKPEESVQPEKELE